jgi:hypothetical protein
MGVVYEGALQMSLKRRVALKVVNQLLADPAQSAAAISSGSRIGRQTASPATLLPVFGFGEDLGGVYFYAMQLIEGATLAEIVATIQNYRWKRPAIVCWFRSFR